MQNGGFEVLFKGERELDEIVALAISDPKGEFNLGETVMPYPVQLVKASLMTGVRLEGNRPGYLLVAQILPIAGKKLLVDPSYYWPNFRACMREGRAPSHDCAVFGLERRTSRLPQYSNFEVLSGFPIKGGVALVRSMVCKPWYDAVAERWTTELEVRDAAMNSLIDFADAFTLTVKSVYGCATVQSLRQNECAPVQSPQQKLVLAAPASRGEQK